MKRIIFHVDVNSAFLSWTAVKAVEQGKEDLRLIPSAIGGDPEKRTGVILAKSVPAKKYGIKTGEPTGMALRKCPKLVLAKPDFKLYRQCSDAFISICREYSPVVEKYSIDECFIDMTGMERIFPDIIKTAYELKDRIKSELGFTVNVGVGSNKLLAKMAGDFEKPDKVHTLFDYEIREKMWRLPVSDLISVGESSAQKLNRLSIHTIGELAELDIETLRANFKNKTAQQLYDYSRGIDDSPVNENQREPKGYGNSTTLQENVTSFEKADEIILNLADYVCARLRADGAKAYCISVLIRSTDFKDKSHQRKLNIPTDITDEIYSVSKELIRELWDGRTPLRLMGISLSDITRDGGEQISLFDSEKKENTRRLDKTVDDIRLKFGKDKIRRASIMNSDIKLK